MSDFISRLTQAYELECEQRRPPVIATDVPFVYEDINSDWLSAVLCAKTPGARVERFELGAPDNGTSNRRKLQVHYNQEGKQAGLEGDLFCKATQDFSSRLLIGPLKAVEGEVNFYNKVAPHLTDLELPVCRHAAYNEALNSIVMLNNLGPGTQFCTHTTTLTRAQAEDQLDLLATLHGRFLSSPELRGEYSVFLTWMEQFGALEPFFRDPCDVGFGLSEEVIPARLFARRKEIWGATQRSVALHAKLPQTLTHSDVHLRNWYIAANGRMGLADWQGVNRGHWSRDLIYVIVTSLNVEQRREWLTPLLEHYHARLQQASGKTIPASEMLDNVRGQLLSVLAFWSMTMVVQPGMSEMVQPRDSTLEFVKRIAIAIDDLDALDAV